LSGGPSEVSHRDYTRPNHAHHNSSPQVNGKTNRLTERTLRVLPPVEFDKPFPGKYNEVRVGASLMQALCPKTTFPVTLGCAIHNTRRAPDESVVMPATECVVVIASDEVLKLYGWSVEIVRRHENGHCNGWPGSHVGARIPGYPQAMHYEGDEPANWEDENVGKGR
jgi:hypothetical protein